MEGYLQHWYKQMEDWFQDRLKRKLGKGNKIKFWENVWASNLSLKEYFARLFSLSKDKDKVVERFGI